MWSELCQLQSGGAGRHTLTRPPPAPCTFLLSAPGPTHCSQPLVTWLVGELSTPTLGKYTPTPSSQLALQHFSRTWTVLERSWTHYHVIWIVTRRDVLSLQAPAALRAVVRLTHTGPGHHWWRQQLESWIISNAAQHLLSWGRTVAWIQTCLRTTCNITHYTTCSSLITRLEYNQYNAWY